MKPKRAVYFFVGKWHGIVRKRPNICKRTFRRQYRSVREHQHCVCVIIWCSRNPNSFAIVLVQLLVECSIICASGEFSSSSNFVRHLIKIWLKNGNFHAINVQSHSITRDIACRRPMCRDLQWKYHIGKIFARSLSHSFRLICVYEWVRAYIWVALSLCVYGKRLNRLYNVCWMRSCNENICFKLLQCSCAFVCLSSSFFLLLLSPALYLIFSAFMFECSAIFGRFTHNIRDRICYTILLCETTFYVYTYYIYIRVFYRAHQKTRYIQLWKVTTATTPHPKKKNK